MSPPKTRTSVEESIGAKEGNWLWAVRILLLAATAGAVFLAWVSLQNGPVAGCGEGSGCNKVLQSRWAYWLGIPVSIPASLAYLSLVAVTFGFSSRYGVSHERWFWGYSWILSIVISLAAVWFFGLQAIVIHAFCKFCLAVHACAVLASAILLAKAPFGRPRPSSGSESGTNPARDVVQGISRATVYAWTLAGFVGGGLLISGQFLVEKRSYVVVAPNQTLSPASDARSDGIQGEAVTSNAAYAAAMAARYQPRISVSQATQAIGSVVRRITPLAVDVHGGLFRFHLDELPMIGTPQSSHIVLTLYDYACHHCRDLHPRLAEIQKRFSNQVAFLLLPTPLNSNCNPVVKISLPEHLNSCEYARLALGVWRASPGAFRQFDDWLFAPAKPMSVADARQYAAQLVGREKLEKALTDDWIMGVLRTNGFLYKTNYQVFKRSTLPELMIGSVTTFGSIPRENDLVDLLSKHLGLQTQSDDRFESFSDSGSRSR